MSESLLASLLGGALLDVLGSGALSHAGLSGGLGLLTSGVAFLSFLAGSAVSS